MQSNDSLETHAVRLLREHRTNVMVQRGMMMNYVQEMQQGNQSERKAPHRNSNYAINVSQLLYILIKEVFNDLLQYMFSMVVALLRKDIGHFGLEAKK